MFETRCANYTFSDYDCYPCQLQCPTGLSSTMGLLWYISPIPCNFCSDTRRCISSMFFFLVMKYVKIYPRVALQMQSNLYAHRTSFAKCILTYTSMLYITKNLKFPYHNWKKAIHFYIMKSLPVHNKEFLICYRFSFNHVLISVKYETIGQLLKMWPCGVYNPILHIAGQNDPFPHQQLFFRAVL